MLSGARALLIALCLQVHTKGGKLRYKCSSGRQHGHFSDRVPGNDVILYVYYKHEGVPECVIWRYNKWPDRWQMAREH